MATAAVGLGLKLGAILGGIIGKKHAVAVAAEANNLNQALPTYQSNLVAIVQALNSGQVNAQDAETAVDEAIAEYYQAVSGIIKDDSSQGQSCSSQDAIGKGGYCNGPCTVGCGVIVPWANKIKTAILSGTTQTVSFSPVPPHAGFNGAAAWSIQVSPASAESILTGVSNAISGTSGASTASTSQVVDIGGMQVSKTALYVGGGALLFIFLVEIMRPRQPQIVMAAPAGMAA